MRAGVGDGELAGDGRRWWVMACDGVPVSRRAAARCRSVRWEASPAPSEDGGHRLGPSCRPWDWWQRNGTLGAQLAHHASLGDRDRLLLHCLKHLINRDGEICWMLVEMVGDGGGLGGRTSDGGEGVRCSVDPSRRRPRRARLSSRVDLVRVKASVRVRVRVPQCARRS